MKKTFAYIALVLLAALLNACSSSSPDITLSQASDLSPVSGQRVLLRVNAVTDNPPMRFTWTYDDSKEQRLEVNGSPTASGTPTDQYLAMWTAPELADPKVPETYTVSCTITDDKDKSETAVFTLNVIPRQYITIVQGGSTSSNPTARYMAKDPILKAGGIWVAASNDNLRYYSSAGNSDSGWGSTFIRWEKTETISAFALLTYSSYYSTWCNFWVARKDIDNSLWEIAAHLTTGDTNYTINDDLGNINAMVMNGSNCWIGATNGLYYFDTVINAWSAKDTSAKITTPINDIRLAAGYMCVANSTGVAFTDSSAATPPWKTTQDPINMKTAIYYQGKTPPADDSCIIGVPANSNPVNVLYRYNVTDGTTSTAGNITIDGDYLQNSVFSIEEDYAHRLWFGKNYWNWQEKKWYSSPADLNGNTLDKFLDADEHIVQTLSSPEGMLYFRTDRGQVIVWGKTPS